jgi:NADH-quinone oxidoreductase subunit L
MLVGALANAGMIPFAGFWAKDEILGAAFVHGYYVVWAVGIVTAFLTALFMFRLIFLTFYGVNRSSEEVQHHIHESPAIMTVPLVILAVPAACLGLIVGLPPEGGWIHGFLEPVFFDVESEPFHLVGEGGLLMLISIVAVLLGIYVAYVGYRLRPEAPQAVVRRAPWAYRASFNKFYMDQVYEVAIIRPVINGANWLWTFFDVKVIDGAVNGLARVWGLFGVALRPVQTGRAQNYALGIFAGVFVLVVVFRWVWGG